MLGPRRIPNRHPRYSGRERDLVRYNEPALNSARSERFLPQSRDVEYRSRDPYGRHETQLSPVRRDRAGQRGQFGGGPEHDSWFEPEETPEDFPSWEEIERDLDSGRLTEEDIHMVDRAADMLERVMSDDVDDDLLNELFKYGDEEFGFEDTRRRVPRDRRITYSGGYDGGCREGAMRIRYGCGYPQHGALREG